MPNVPRRLRQLPIPLPFGHVQGLELTDDSYQPLRFRPGNEATLALTFANEGGVLVTDCVYVDLVLVSRKPQFRQIRLQVAEPVRTDRPSLTDDQHGAVRHLRLVAYG